MSQIVQKNADEWLRVPDIQAKHKVSRSFWWRLSALSDAPKPRRIGKRWTAWRASEVEAFLEKISGGLR